MEGMTPAKYTILFFAAMIIGNILVWFQTNGQIVWKSLQDYTVYMAVFGAPISFLFIKATYWGFHAFGEKLWPIRMAGFSISMIVFSVMTAFIMHELPDAKTIVSLLLCFAVILIQIFF